MHPHPTQPHASIPLPHEAAQSANELLAGFDSYLQRHGRAPATRDRYSRVLSTYTSWLNGRPATTITAEELDRYLDHWQHHFTHHYGRPAAPGSGPDPFPLTLLD